MDTLSFAEAGKSFQSTSDPSLRDSLRFEAGLGSIELVWVETHVICIPLVASTLELKKNYFCSQAFLSCFCKLENHLCYLTQIAYCTKGTCETIAFSAGF